MDKIINLNSNIKKNETPHRIEIIKREIDSVDKQIDQLVYKLYGLTEEEIKIVEGDNGIFL